MKMRILSILLLAVVVLAGASRAGAQTPAPMIFFTDLTGGPNSGGESVSGYAGAYITIYGNNFGASQGTSTVTWNGQNCLRVVPATGSYTGWGTSYFWYQKIVVQLGSSCTAGTGNFVVTVNGAASTSPSSSISGTAIPGAQFTVRSTGNIYCVSTSGSDSNSGAFGSCWATPAHAISTMAAGAIAYVENGVTQAAETAFGAVVNIEGNPGGTSTNPIALVTYPGATATIGALNAGVQYAVRIPQIGDSPAWYTVAGLTLRGDEALEIAGASDMRFVANDISCDSATGFGCAHVDTTKIVWMYGNNLHDVGSQCATNSGNPTGSACKFHGYYYTTNTIHVDHGWNITNMDPSGSVDGGCYGVQFYSTGGADQYDLHVHDSLFKNIVCGAINFSTVNPDAGTVEAYNNVLFHVGTGPDPSGTSAAYYGVGTAAMSTHTNPVLVYNNSMYDVGSRGNVTNSNACVNATIATKIVNNVCQITGSGEQYMTTNSSAIDCALFSGSDNDWYGNSGPLCASSVSASLNVNPLFTSTVSGSQNLFPQASSPVFGAGTGAQVSAYDIEGLRRPSPPSMGAYELSAGAVTLPNPPTNLQVSVQ
jgi:hypothetical protein